MGVGIDGYDMRIGLDGMVWYGMSTMNGINRSMFIDAPIIMRLEIR